MSGEVIIVTKAQPVQLLASMEPFEAHAMLRERILDSAEQLSDRFGQTFTPIFDPPAGQRLSASIRPMTIPGQPPPPADFHSVPSTERYLTTPVVTQEEAARIVTEVIQAPDVEAAYYKPAAEPAVINDMLPRTENPRSTQSFIHLQGYLQAAPHGVDALWASNLPGGRGQGIAVIDIEGGFRFSHECFRPRLGGLIHGSDTTALWRNHGTAVLGELWGQGTTLRGICPEAEARAISHLDSSDEPGLGSSRAIFLAGEFLYPGDVLLLEMHRPGPRDNYRARQDQFGYIAVEWWPDDLEAIRALARRGILVVGAAGNGGQDLDDPLYSIRPSRHPVQFPQTWKNPFARGQAASGGLLVGAGAPPSGRCGPDRSRLDFSNYGSAVDAQGWGREVTTAGYGDLQGGMEEDYWYTSEFSGTSSASPMIAGVLVCIQSHLKAVGVSQLTPAEAIATLRATGSPQVDNPPTFPITQRIGARPDLRGAINHARGLRGLPPV